MKKAGIFTLMMLSCLFSAVNSQSTYSVSIDTYGLFSGNRIIYMDYKYVSSYVFYASLKMTDLNNGTTTVLVPNDNSSPYYIYFSCDKSNLTYMINETSSGRTGRNSSSSLNLMDLNTKQVSLVTSVASYKETPWISGNVLVWIDYRNITTTDTLNGDVYLYDIAAKQERRLTSTSYYEGKPATDGKNVVWIDYANGSYGNIYLYNMGSGTGKIINKSSFHQDNPRISGDHVIWEDYRNAVAIKNSDIYSYDISTGATSVICSASGYQGNPYVYGSIAVWEDYRNATTDPKNADVYGYNFNSKKEIELIKGQGYQGHPVVDSTRICWMNSVNNVMTLNVQNLSSTAVKQIQKSTFLENGSYSLYKFNSLTGKDQFPNSLPYRIFDLAGRNGASDLITFKSQGLFVIKR